MEYFLVAAWLWTAGENEGRYSLTESPAMTQEECDTLGREAKVYKWPDRYVTHWACVVLPPAKYDYPAKNMEVVYDATIFIRVTCEQIEALACVLAPLDDDGNVIRDDDGSIPHCIALLPHGAEADSALYRHEQAHCNGWPADHRAKDGLP